MRDLRFFLLLALFLPIRLIGAEAIKEHRCDNDSQERDKSFIAEFELVLFHEPAISDQKPDHAEQVIEKFRALLKGVPERGNVADVFQKFINAARSDELDLVLVEQILNDLQSRAESGLNFTLTQPALINIETMLKSDTNSRTLYQKGISYIEGIGWIDCAIKGVGIGLMAAFASSPILTYFCLISCLRCPPSYAVAYGGPAPCYNYSYTCPDNQPYDGSCNPSEFHSSWSGYESCGPPCWITGTITAALPLVSVCSFLAAKACRNIYIYVKPKPQGETVQEAMADLERKMGTTFGYLTPILPYYLRLREPRPGVI